MATQLFLAWLACWMASYHRAPTSKYLSIMFIFSRISYPCTLESFSCFVSFLASNRISFLSRATINKSFDFILEENIGKGRVYYQQTLNVPHLQRKPHRIYDKAAIGNTYISVVISFLFEIKEIRIKILNSFQIPCVLGQLEITEFKCKKNFQQCNITITKTSINQLQFSNEAIFGHSGCYFSFYFL